MPRSSRHKSHRTHKHSSRDGRDRSESEEERSPREGRPTAEEPVAPSKGRVSGNSELEKRKSSAKEGVGSGEGGSGEKHRKKRKERPENSETWNASDKDSKREEFGPSEMENVGKVKALPNDLVGKNSKKHEGSFNGYEESGGKRRPEKDSSPRDGRIQNKDVKERDSEHMLGEDSRRWESASLCEDSKERDRDKKNEEDSGRLDSHYLDSKERETLRKTDELHRHSSGGKSQRRASGSEYKNSKDRDRSRRSERDDGKAEKRSDDFANRDEDGFKNDRKNHDNYDSHLEIDIRSPELSKEVGKHSRRRDASRDKDKRQGDSRDNEDRRVSSRDDRSKNGSCRDEKHKESRYREKPRDDHDRDRRNYDEKYRDERSSRDHDRDDSKYYREDNKSESRHKRSKPHDGDPDDNSYIDDHGTKYKDSRGRKQFPDEKFEEYSDLKHQNSKELCGDREKTSSGAAKFESNSDGSKLENSRSGRVDSSFSNALPKGSSPSSHGYMEQSRHSLKHEESLHKHSPSGERIRSNSDRSSEKTKSKDASYSRHNRTPRSDSHASPNKLMERSSTANERKLSNKAGPRRILENEEMVRKVGGASKEARDHLAFEDKERDISEKQSVDAYTRTNSHDKLVSGSSSSYDRMDSHPFRGIDSPTFVGSYEDDGRGKSTGCFRRSSGGGGDACMGRGLSAGSWNGAPTWSSTMANGFLPLPQGPQPGFHPPLQQFSTTLYGVRHIGLPYNIHEAPVRYAGLVRPFGWPGRVIDSCPPLLQDWDTNNGVFGEETRPFGRSDWDHNRNMMSNNGWKGENGNMKFEYSGPVANEGWAGQTRNQLHDERAQLDPRDFLPVSKNVVETPSKSLSERRFESAKSPKMPRASKETENDSIRACCCYLSKLDVSLDLTPPELYEQCMSVVDHPQDSKNNKVYKGFLHQGNIMQRARKIDFLHRNKEKPREGIPDAMEIINHLLPKSADTFLKRAMSLYKKRAGGLKAEAVVARSSSSPGGDGSPPDLLVGIVGAPKPVDLGLAFRGSPVPVPSIDLEEETEEWESCLDSCSGGGGIPPDFLEGILGDPKPVDPGLACCGSPVPIPSIELEEETEEQESCPVPDSGCGGGGSPPDFLEGILGDPKPVEPGLACCGSPVPFPSMELEEETEERASYPVPDSGGRSTGTQYTDPSHCLIVSECRVNNNNNNRIHSSSGSTH